MQALGYLAVNGREVLNNYRLYENLGCHLGSINIFKVSPPCGILGMERRRLHYDEHITYDADVPYDGGWMEIDWTAPDPWHSSDPNSDDFLGFWVESFEIPSTARRTTYPLSTNAGGSTIGRIRYTQREMPMELLLVATSSAGIWYGANWLESQLLGSGCGGQSVTVRLFCPDEGTPLDGMHTLHSVTILDPPEDNGSPMEFEKCLIRSVNLTLVAGDPQMYSS